MTYFKRRNLMTSQIDVIIDILEVYYVKINL